MIDETTPDVTQKTNTTDGAVKRVHLSMRTVTRAALDDLRVQLRKSGTAGLPDDVETIITCSEWSADTLVAAGCAAIDYLLRTADTVVWLSERSKDLVLAVQQAQGFPLTRAGRKQAVDWIVCEYVPEYLRAGKEVAERPVKKPSKR